MSDLSYNAMIFALDVHKNQKRKYTDNPYFTHLAEVAGLVATIRYDDASIATAWLHDCIEDQGTTMVLLRNIFNETIAEGVLLLSDLECGNRERRKQLSRERLSNAPDWVQDIKVCDLISNTSSIVQHDPKFAVIYLEEKRLMLDVLTRADARLIEIAKGIINDR